MAIALYRRYRPESFAEVIGQDHVTTPLRRALRAGRIGHAYLFSGPRGCGKTTSARILARCLNCAQGPTDEPCGQCDSCRDLATGGSGSLDVVEIDAASHGGVDDARELRERASFAPVRDRYKVFIIDEAHMVTSAGFNALLKLVEEPPEHVKFVFATTEPDKVIGTIRSRTHHYPFRLIPPQVLGPYLEEVCAAEGVEVGEGVMPLVVRAGGGSARDSMSVLDQLMAGAGDDGLDFSTAIALLGFTDTALLDSAITAVAERDAAALYSAVEHVLATGHEPRRFVEDLLERMRDLIVLAAVPDRGADLLPQVPADELESMRGQAALFAPADLSQCGDLVHETLSTMSGATSPRLHLELLAARLVLRDERAALAAAGAPAPTNDQRGGAPAGGGPSGAAPPPDASSGASGARDQARRIAQEKVEAARQARGGRGGAAAAPASAPASAQPRAPEQPPAPERQSAAPAAQGTAPRPQATAPASSAPAAPAEPSAAPPAQAPWGDSAPQASQQAPHQAPPQSTGRDAGPQRPPAGNAAATEPPTPNAAAPQTPPSVQPAAGGGIDADQVRGNWSAILDELQQIRRPSWALISQNGHVNGAHGGTLVIGFRTDGLVNAFHRGTAAQNLADAVRRIMHVEVTIEAVVGDDPGPGPGNAPSPGSPGPGSAAGGGGPESSGPESSGGAGGPGRPVGDSTNGGAAAGQVQHGPSPDVQAAAPQPTGASGQSEEQTPVRWGDAVTATAPREPAPAPAASPEEPPTASAGQRASERAMRAAERAARTSRPGSTAERIEDFPPEPDDPFPPDPQDSYQPRHPQDDYQPQNPQPTGAATAEAAAAAAGSAPHGEIAEVEDEGRDSLPPEESRTYGQRALRRAIAEGRVVRSRPTQGHGAGAGASDAGDTRAEPPGASAGDAPLTDGPGSGTGRPALQTAAPAEPGSAGGAASADAAPASPGPGASASARAAASWGTAATVPAATNSAATSPAATSPAATGPASQLPPRALQAALLRRPRAAVPLWCARRRRPPAMPASASGGCVASHVRNRPRTSTPPVARRATTRTRWSPPATAARSSRSCSAARSSRSSTRTGTTSRGSARGHAA
ncbi:DNA polymerase III subunit gamma and tau [Brachybacterium avium]|uniref:DNA polymerase III subunit gamma and tau n=1 Tax=Brachybacterium avium TaxID=2017485 RepID=UPI0012FD2EF9|nr:DNA polymerase III subunit gamma and tau [Brachybacterium avium]